MLEIEKVKGLSDDEVVSCLTRCVLDDRHSTVRLLVHLAEVDARGLFRDHGFPSMFDYAVRKLHMSESEAWLRICVARLGRQFPHALELLDRGELHLTALRLLAPVLTHDNIGLLEEARFKSKKELLELLAQHTPRPDAPVSIRRLPEPKLSATRASESKATAPSIDFVLLGSAARSAACSTQSKVSLSLDSPVAMGELESITSMAHPGSRAVRPVGACASRTEPALVAMRAAATRPAAGGHTRATPSAAVDPLSPGRFKLTFTMSQRLRDKLEEAQDLLRHQIRDGDVEQVFERALDLLIAQSKKQRFGQTDKPRTQPPENETNDSRYIPREVRRQVWLRCSGRCSFVAPDGHRCAARGSLEFHHIDPYARGGATTSDNLTLMCRAHNTLLAERDYGRHFMHRRVSAARSTRDTSPVDPQDRPHQVGTRHAQSPNDTRHHPPGPAKIAATAQSSRHPRPPTSPSTTTHVPVHETRVSSHRTGLRAHAEQRSGCHGQHRRYEQPQDPHPPNDSRNTLAKDRSNDAANGGRQSDLPHI